MQMTKVFASGVVVASITAASPVTPDGKQTPRFNVAQADSNNDDAHFQLFGRSLTLPFNSTNMQQHGASRKQLNLTKQKRYRRHLAAAAEDEGRPGKVPYRRFPECYVKCFDSEGVTSKTSMFIGDIRDLTVHEFCVSQDGWVGGWIYDYLLPCVRGGCDHCDPECGIASGKVYEGICGHSFWDGGP
ncbi:hypothetical protein G7054_g2100 [Neopestalotiopsis clavispora]|nr:hypothetical protein G7054_g2100 [Neopestalotiopsis clavispora]